MRPSIRLQSCAERPSPRPAEAPEKATLVECDTSAQARNYVVLSPAKFQLLGMLLWHCRIMSGHAWPARRSSDQVISRQIWSHQRLGWLTRSLMRRWCLVRSYLVLSSLIWSAEPIISFLPSRVRQCKGAAGKKGRDCRRVAVVNTNSKAR